MATITSFLFVRFKFYRGIKVTGQGLIFNNLTIAGILSKCLYRYMTQCYFKQPSSKFFTILSLFYFPLLFKNTKFYFFSGAATCVDPRTSRL